MKTDELINSLSTHVPPVNHWRTGRAIVIAILIGGAAALGAGYLALGTRSDLGESDARLYLTIKLAFVSVVIVLATTVLTRLARPGGEYRIRKSVVGLPFVAMLLLALLSLGQAPSAHWEEMIVGQMWLQCLLIIPALAIIPFALVTWVVHRVAAPTDLRLTGAFAGLVAGSMSAMGYALHCTDDALPFIALWYGGTIGLCTGIGAVLGPRLLRW